MKFILQASPPVMMFSLVLGLAMLIIFTVFFIEFIESAKGKEYLTSRNNILKVIFSGLFLAVLVFAAVTLGSLYLFFLLI
jgi:hypothetical protein